MGNLQSQRPCDVIREQFSRNVTDYVLEPVRTQSENGDIVTYAREQVPTCPFNSLPRLEGPVTNIQDAKWIGVHTMGDVVRVMCVWDNIPKGQGKQLFQPHEWCIAAAVSDPDAGLLHPTLMGQARTTIHQLLNPSFTGHAARVYADCRFVSEWLSYGFRMAETMLDVDNKRCLYSVDYPSVIDGRWIRTKPHLKPEKKIWLGAVDVHSAQATGCHRIDPPEA